MNTNSSAKSIEWWLADATKKLEQAGIGSARLDALILLEDELGKDRSWLLAHPEHAIQGRSLKRLNSRILRRIMHEPMAYIRRRTEFYNLLFYIDHRVLEPRPESETIIDIFKSLPIFKDGPCRVVDAGTGSGALAVTVKKLLPAAEVCATDIDPKCLAVASKNAALHKVDISFHKTDLVKSLADKLGDNTVILANLPYVPEGHKLNQAAQNEPRLAIFGGKDGLDLYAKLFRQLEVRKDKPRYVITESLPPQHKKLEQLAKRAGFKLLRKDDFIQLFAA